MLGELPRAAHTYRVVSGHTERQAFAARPPGPGEVVIEVAGSALGAAPGAEIAGVVVAAGEAAGEWLGRRVVAPRLLPCGECDRCRRGRTAACRAPAARGPVASCETVPARFLLSLEPPLWPDGVELSWLALLADAAATPYAALARGQVGPGDVAVVIGGGARGRLTAELAVAKGAAAVLLEPDATLRGADEPAEFLHLLDGHGSTDELLARIAALPREHAGSPVEIKLIETTGTTGGRQRALELCARAGATAVLLGDGDAADVALPVAELAAREAQILGAGPAHPDLLPELCALVVRGQLALERHCATFAFEDYARVQADHRAHRLLRLPVLVPAPPARVDSPGSPRP